MNRRQIRYSTSKSVALPNATRLGFAKTRAKGGDVIVYKEYFADDSYHLRTARVIGRILWTDEGGPSGVGQLCALALSDGATHGYERWVDPANVVECWHAEEVRHFLGWMLSAKPATLAKYIYADPDTRNAAQLPRARFYELVGLGSKKASAR